PLRPLCDCLPPGANHRLGFRAHRDGHRGGQQGSDGADAPSASHSQLRGSPRRQVRRAPAERLSKTRRRRQACGRRLEMKPLLAVLVLLLANAARADFVTFTSAAEIREYPVTYSRVLVRVEAGDMAELVSRRSENGFYLVRFGETDNQIGYVD